MYVSAFAFLPMRHLDLWHNGSHDIRAYKKFTSKACGFQKNEKTTEMD